MTRWSVLAGKQAVCGLGMVLVALAAPRVAMAQDAPPQDVLKFSTNAPAIIVSQIKAEMTAQFEEGWAAIRGLCAKSDDAGVRAFGESLGNLYRVDQPPFQTPNGMAVIYIFNLTSPSTTYSYNPTEILYNTLKAGQEGSAVTREEADAIFEKLKGAYLVINPPWVLVRAR
jgi:hypothetical protein